MVEAAANSGDSASVESRAGQLPAGWLSRWPWVTFLLPMIVYMLMGTLEPKPPQVAEKVDEATAEFERQIAESFDEEGLLPAIRYEHYPLIYTAKIVLTLVTMVLVWPGYGSFPLKVSCMSVVVGVVGVVLWIGLCRLQLEPKLIGPVDRFLGGLLPMELGPEEEPTIGLMGILGTGERSAFNPLEELREAGVWAYVFLAIRFAGLALVVPVIEEFFLRGFLMRYVVHENWWLVPFGAVNRTAVIAGTAIPMLMHPGELLAALVWFSMVTWLMVRTRNIWDCVAAHAVTNFLLGAYVVASGEWQLM
ncbi:MAG: CAAX prenyl protease-related protein [Planctomycetales bacterium]|nr:CAAX prenyl protease-related protein [Planctomycetales bacterium]